MTTAAPAKTSITTTWNTSKIQEEAVAAMVRQMGVIQKVLPTLSPQAEETFRKEMNAAKAAHYRTLGVKTPLQLVQAMAEFEANVLGSKIRIWGDEKEAHMEYEHCACFQAMQKACSMTEKDMEAMSHKFTACVSTLASEFGFKGEIRFPKSPSELATITFKA